MEFKNIVGKTLASIEQFEERIIFNFSDGTACESYHSHDCCETVAVDHVEGDVNDIIGQPILEADEVEDDHGEPAPDSPESWTWTRQRIKTAGGEVMFVWLGESNGYYSETPYFQITHGTEV